MKFILSIIFIIPFLSISQNILKKKYCGNYLGSIPAYKMEDGKMIVEVDSVSIQIEFLKDGTVNYTIGNTKDHGTYNVEFTTDSFILISAKLENQKADEKMKLYLKDKHLEREGIYPQPEGRLVKLKE